MKISVSLYNAPKKSEDQNLRQVIFRVREGNNDLKVRTDLMADPKLWDESIQATDAPPSWAKAAQRHSMIGCKTSSVLSKPTSHRCVMASG